MKGINLGLTDSTTLTYGDTTKTYLAGRFRPNTISGKSVVAPALTAFADVQTAYGVTPGHCIVNPATGRKFELANVTTNTPTILAFNFDIVTGQWTFIGKITMTLPVGVHTYRGLEFDDSDTNNIKLIVTSTVTTALCQGGTFYTWNVALSDFTLAGTTIPTATGSNQKAVYFAQYAGQLGLNHVGTTSGGVAHGRNMNTAALKTRFYQQNGTSALPVIYGWDTSLGNPSVAGAVTNGVACQTTAFAGTAPSAYFSMGASNNGFSSTTPVAAAFEAIVMFNGTTNVPANFTASPFGTAQTIYYMRDLQLVSGVWYFNLSLTAAGTAVVPTSNSATFSMCRQGGISSSHSLLKTGSLSPSMLGTILQSNSFGCCIPTSVPVAASLNGQECFFLASNSSLVLVKISDIADGSTTWSSKVEVNLTGGVGDPQITAPSALLAQYSSYLDQWIYVTNTSKFVMKPHQNTKITKVFGALSNAYMEGNNLSSVPLGMAVIVTLNLSAGWMFITGSTTGQRGVIAADLWSDDYFGNSYAISKVLYVPPGSKLRFFTTDEAGASYTGDTAFHIRSSTTATDPIFSSPTGGWIDYSGYQDESPALVGPYFQVKLGSTIITDNSNASPVQLHDVVVMYDEPGEIDENFVWNEERSSKSGDSPMVVSVRQVKALAAAPTKFVLVGYDDAGNIVQTIDSSVTPSVFAQSSNSGTSYTTFTNMAAFMTSFNSSSGNTELKVTVTSPPAIPYVTWSFYYA